MCIDKDYVMRFIFNYTVYDITVIYEVWNPKVITTDQDSEFNNKLDSTLMTLLNVDHRLTTPYHPQVLYIYTTLHLIIISQQANGLDERLNQTVQKMLVKYAKEQKECWEDYLECCLFAYNTSKHELMFGCQAVLPIEVHCCSNTASLVDDKQLDNNDVEVRMLHQRKVSEVVKMNIAAAQTRQKEQYDRKHYNPDVFEPGSIVLKKDFRRKKCVQGESKTSHGWVHTE